MNKQVYFFRLLGVVCFTAFFSACAPRYGAHFQSTPGPSYGPEVNKEVPAELLAVQEKAVAEQEVALRSGAETAESDKLPAAQALQGMLAQKEMPEVKDLSLQQQEVITQVRESLQQMSRAEKRALRREIRQLRLSGNLESIYSRAEAMGIEQDDVNEATLLLVLLAIFIPPLGVFLHQGEINNKFWISLLLTLLFFVPGAIYSVLVVLGEI